MSFVVRKLPLAEQDALDAAIWYEERQPGLGEEFLDEVERAVRALSESALQVLDPICGRASRADTSLQVLRHLLRDSRTRGLDISDLSWTASPAGLARTRWANWVTPVCLFAADAAAATKRGRDGAHPSMAHRVADKVRLPETLKRCG
jgi:hypothetical protein